MANYKVECINKDKFFEELNSNNIPFVKMAVDIINSHEENKQSDLKEIENRFLNDSYTAFADSKDACAFVLLRDEKPISFALFENVDFDGDVIDTSMVWTRDGAEGQGYGRSLIRYALSYYANNTNCKTCRAIINNKNEKSIRLHKYFENQYGAKIFLSGGKVICELDIDKFKDVKDFEIVESDSFTLSA